jgi:hypothetical protein
MMYVMGKPPQIPAREDCHWAAAGKGKSVFANPASTSKVVTSWPQSCIWQDTLVPLSA